MREVPVIKATVTFLARGDGGRTRPPDLSSGQYMPHLVAQSPDVRSVQVVEGNVIADHYLGVRFLAGPMEPRPGDPVDCEMELMYHPTVGYEALQAGATFTVREGGKIVGFGMVQSRADGSSRANCRT